MANESVRTIILSGKPLPVLSFKGQKDIQDGYYLMGIDMAKHLGRKSFNVYRCLRKQHIKLIRLKESRIKTLVDTGYLRKGIHSVTLIPYNEGINYMTRSTSKRPPMTNKRKREEKAIRILAAMRAGQLPTVDTSHLGRSRQRA